MSNKGKVMTIPPSIKAEAMGAACDHDAQPIVDDFVLGAEWLFLRLMQLSEEEFNESDDEFLKRFVRDFSPLTEMLKAERAKVLALEAEVARLKEIHKGCANLVIQLDAERAKCSRLERALREIENEAIKAEKHGCNITRKCVCDIVGQALAEGAE